ncbi:hypothetical protein JCM6882_006671 [Rhodosporidiobolus microsporus]
MAATPPKAPSRAVVLLLVGGMLITGCSNSLWTKYQDMQCVVNCDSPDPSKRQNFEQPVWQTGTMFLGEMLCLVAFTFLNSRLNPFRLASRRRARAAHSARAAAHAHESARLHSGPLSDPDESAVGFGESSISLQREDGGDGGYDSVSGASTPVRPPLKSAETGSVAAAAGAEGPGMKWSEAVLFWLPSLCDIFGTTCMNVGLFFIPVSVYQMTRGALVLWVGLFSVVFLKRSLTRAQWVALGVCMLGVGIVGAASLVGNSGKEPSESTTAEEGSVSPIVGFLLVLVAQIFTATQFVLEERIMEHHAVEPLLAAGYEGVFGFITTASALLVAYRFYGSTPAGADGYFDVKAGWHQLVDYPKVFWSSVVIMFSIAGFNFCGLAVTRTVSATARSTIDSCRTLGIWAVSLFLGWETFKFLQVIGFALLVYGTFVFNGIQSFPHWTGLHRDALPAGAPGGEDDSYSRVPAVVVEDTDASEDEGVAGGTAPVRRSKKKAVGGARDGEDRPLLG